MPQVITLAEAILTSAVTRASLGTILYCVVSNETFKGVVEVTVKIDQHLQRESNNHSLWKSEPKTFAYSKFYWLIAQKWWEGQISMWRICRWHHINFFKKTIFLEFLLLGSCFFTDMTQFFCFMRKKALIMQMQMLADYSGLYPRILSDTLLREEDISHDRNRHCLCPNRCM